MEAHENHQPDSDITQALHHAEASAVALEDIRKGAIALSEAQRQNPVLYLWWGMRSAMQKASWEAKEHPWWAALSLVGSLACAHWACIYFGITVLTGMIIWAVQKRTSIPHK